jgi:hypothetical protein
VPTPADQGIPGWFIAFAFFVVVIGIGTTIWKYSVAKQGAQKLGLDESTAAQMAFLDPNATAVAGQLGAAAIARMKEQEGKDLTDNSRDLNDRLADLDEAHANGRVSDDEYQQIRKRLLDTF